MPITTFLTICRKKKTCQKWFNCHEVHKSSFATRRSLWKSTLLGVATSPQGLIAKVFNRKKYIKNAYFQYLRKSDNPGRYTKDGEEISDRAFFPCDMAPLLWFSADEPDESPRAKSDIVYVAKQPQRHGRQWLFDIATDLFTIKKSPWDFMSSTSHYMQI